MWERALSLCTPGACARVCVWCVCVTAPACVAVSTHREILALHLLLQHLVSWTLSCTMRDRVAWDLDPFLLWVLRGYWSH